MIVLMHGIICLYRTQNAVTVQRFVMNALTIFYRCAVERLYHGLARQFQPTGMQGAAKSGELIPVHHRHSTPHPWKHLREALPQEGLIYHFLRLPKGRKRSLRSHTARFRNSCFPTTVRFVLMHVTLILAWQRNITDHLLQYNGRMFSNCALH